MTVLGLSMAIASVTQSATQLAQFGELPD
jgi:hypothetical protein